MASVHSDRAAHSASADFTALKLLIMRRLRRGEDHAGGVGQRDPPAAHRGTLTEASRPVDSLEGVAAKTTTTVAMDFGRITLRDTLALYLFGTPGQDRFWFVWDELATGCLGAVVLADTRRLADCFPAIDYFESRGIPFIVAVNCFDGIRTHSREAVARALDLTADTPVTLCDVRDRESGKDVLISLVEHVLTLESIPN